MEKIILGQEVQDRITGFKGIAVSRTAFLQGCDRIGLQPKVKEDGELPEEKIFDELDLIVIGDGIKVKEEIPKVPAPRREVVRRSSGGPHGHTATAGRH